ncbi:MBL fold metallo-hydrolase RNA specificity domain-containing protein [Thiocystis violacea]|uniref:MBL fold metallo-hydrolase RNA specificity domain-containing protein n=1 Tax=Thiocystis violacea TaxID=13725 RepID=UPI00190375E5|nr:MBL fold metallo-hydrolase [Thiocystis violacea]MBK1723134.1 MBL fold metallo-hydrolase [Thiocystis violacea]
MNVSFHGANRSVTGSCHLIEVGGLRVLVDCGLFQGGREIDEDNAEDFGFDPRAIDVLLLTHAHLDHCGRIPLLARRGFAGEIIATAATRELTRVVLLDAAHLQEEEAKRLARKAHRQGRSLPEPLYSTLDALNAMDLFGRKADYGKPIPLNDRISVTFHDAGHILGSASLRLEAREGGATKAIIFSGDLGNKDRPILRDPHIPPHAETLVMETTYGDRRHKALAPSIQELYAAIDTTLARGGNVIIPTFALERAQEVLYYLREGVEQGALPKHLPVFLDSPMAISATEIFRRHPECYDAEARALFEQGTDPFAPPNLRFTRESTESMALNQLAGGAVIMAGSGMCTGGRVRHHLRHTLWRRDSSVIFVGFAAPGTLARILIDGAKRVRLFGDEIPVRAHLHTINGFSAHADCDELLAWHRAIKPERTILVHGEETAMRTFADQLQGTEVVMPRQNQSLGL